MRNPRKPSLRRATLIDTVVGSLGTALIAVTLLGVRVWSRVTRTPYYKD